MISEEYVKDEVPYNMETIMLYGLDQMICNYEKDIFHYLQTRQYEKCDEKLMEFCIEALTLPEEQQLFTVKLFFISTVMNILQIQSSKEHLPGEIYANSYRLIAEIERLTDVASFMLYISTFMNELQTKIIVDHLLFKGNHHIEKALKLIHDHLKSNHLNVNWLACQLGITTTHLSNLFKQYMDEHISHYIATKKVNAIIYALMHTNESLKSIREAFGFHNHSYFIQFFKKYTGTTPLKFLQENIS